METKWIKDLEHTWNEEAIRQAGQIIRDGGLVAFPTETVYGLGGDALNPDSSRKIYAAKGRPSDNPLIVHICRLEDLSKIAAEIPENAKKLAEKFWPGPLTMIFKKTDLVPKETTGGLDTVAVRFPDHKVALAFIEAAGGFVAAPSANTSGRPSPTTAGHVAEDLGEAIDMIIDGGQVNIGLESTIVDFTEDIPVVLRPGYISLEMLRETLGDVRMDKGLIKPDSKVHPKAPGMKYRHYAPKGQLTLVEGDRDKVIAKINELVKEKEEEGHKVGVIGTDETLDSYHADILTSTGLKISDLVWSASKSNYNNGLQNNQKIHINATEASGDFTVSASVTDDAGHVFTSNQAVVHVVRIEADRKSMAYMSSAKLTIYGLEELAAGGLKIASSTDEIKEDSGSGNFYLYDTRGVLSFGRPTKNVDGSWECTATFDPDRSILRWLFGGFRSQSTSIGVYRAGETIRRTDKNGSTYEYGFSVNKMGISWN